MIVPRDAILQEGSQHYVYRIQNGQPQRTVVTIVSREGLQAGIEADSLKPGDEVIIRGHERLRPGQPIEIVQSS